MQQSVLSRRYGGVKIDIEHARRCIQDLDIKCEVLRQEIEPLLPPTVKVKALKLVNPR